MKDKFKRKTVVVVVFSLLICIALGSVSSYFTDHHELINVFTTGNVSIKAEEPEYNSPENVKDRENLVPGQSIVKDPVITNTGKSDCFVFAKVNIPRSNRIFIDEAGKKMPVENRNLFNFTLNEGWTCLRSGINDTIKNPYETFVLAYSDGINMTPLKPSQNTGSIFKDKKVNFANVIEISGKETYEIPVEVYAIQTTDVKETEGGSKDPETVYREIFMQLFDESI